MEAAGRVWLSSGWDWDNAGTCRAGVAEPLRHPLCLDGMEGREGLHLPGWISELCSAP